MRLTGRIGGRSDGSFVAEFAAPGEDMQLANARRLFSTDATFVQVLFSETVAFTYNVQTFTTNGPFGAVTTYVLTGSATYLFPVVLSFKPEIYLTTFITKNGESEYQLASAPSPRNITHEVYNDRVVLGYTQTFFDSISVSALSARVTALNTPWDRT
jgi:hypothetical protein